MNANNVKYLKETYSKMFRGLEYFDVGDGWFHLIDELAKDIYTLETIPVCVQVKEKLGGLRVYMSYGSEDIHALVLKAQNQSEKTCEVCGKSGKLIDSGWMRTRCEEHA